MDRSVDESACRARYRGAVRRNTVWWATMLAALVVLGVFHRPTAWGDGRAATAVVWIGRIVALVSIVGLAQSARRVGEAVGFCLGAFDRHPAEPVEGSGG